MAIRVNGANKGVNMTQEERLAAFKKEVADAKAKKEHVKKDCGCRRNKGK